MGKKRKFTKDQCVLLNNIADTPSRKKAMADFTNSSLSTIYHSCALGDAYGESKKKDKQILALEQELQAYRLNDVIATITKHKKQKRQ